MYTIPSTILTIIWGSHSQNHVSARFLLSLGPLLPRSRLRSKQGKLTAPLAIGNNRFRAPINYTWSENTYNASAFKKTCWQPGATALTADEDCLYLHIQVPSGHTGASNLPVLIYL